jgi:hypothetical protein
MTEEYLSVYSYETELLIRPIMVRRLMKIDRLTILFRMEWARGHNFEFVDVRLPGACL